MAGVPSVELGSFTPLRRWKQRGGAALQESYLKLNKSNKSPMAGMLLGT